MENGTWVVRCCWRTARARSLVHPKSWTSLLPYRYSSAIVLYFCTDNVHRIQEWYIHNLLFNVCMWQSVKIDKNANIQILIYTKIDCLEYVFVSTSRSGGRAKINNIHIHFFEYSSTNDPLPHVLTRCRNEFIKARVIFHLRSHTKAVHVQTSIALRVRFNLSSHSLYTPSPHSRSDTVSYIYIYMPRRQPRMHHANNIEMHVPAKVNIRDSVSPSPIYNYTRARAYLVRAWDLF